MGEIIDRKKEGVKICTVCPGSSAPIYIVSYNIKWDTTSWTKSIYKRCIYLERERERGKRKTEARQIKITKI